MSASLPRPALNNPPSIEKTLRDDFAMAAMNAYIDPDFLKSAMTEEEAELLFVNCANFAYRMADAMLKVRENKNE